MATDTQATEPTPTEPAPPAVPTGRWQVLRARFSHAMRPWYAANRMARGFVVSGVIITLAFMALSAFLLIGALLVTAVASDRSQRKATP